MMRKSKLIGLMFLFVLGFVSPLRAQNNAPVQYFYDDLGRLTLFHAVRIEGAIKNGFPIRLGERAWSGNPSLLR